MEKKKDIEFKDMFNSIVALHGLPVTLLLRIGTDGKVHLVAAATNSNTLGIVATEKEHMEYVG